MDLKAIQDHIFETIRSEVVSSCELVVSDGRLSAGDRLNTYKTSAYLKPYSCLSDDYQVTKVILGEERFDEIIEAYLKRYPADTHYINECGRMFPDFLVEIELEEPLLLKDLARLEWLRVESFFDFFNYKKKDDVSGSIKTNLSIKLIKSEWPLHLVWDNERVYDRQQTEVFVWTTEDRNVHVQAWENNETKVLQKILQVSCLDAGVESLLLNFESEELTDILTKNLSTWINLGLFEIM